MSSLASRRHILLGALTLPLLHLPVSIAQASSMVKVGSSADLDRALANASAGTTIVLRNGTYQKSGRFELHRNGSSASPIRIVAENHLGATIRGGGLLLSGTHVHVAGLRFDNAPARLEDDHCRLAHCSFSGSNGRASVDGAANVVINNNEFRGWGDRCIAFNPLLNGAGKNPHIHSNYFHDSSNVAIGLGLQHDHQMLRVSALVERNLFVNCSHDQVVNCKSSNNRVRQNTMINSGAFVGRFGVDNSFENNWIDSSRGIWLSDRNCSASGNRLNDSEIWVLAGNITSDRVRSEVGRHPRAESARVVNNAAKRTVVGMAWSGFNLPAINTVVDRHNGRVDRNREQGTQIRSTNDSSAGSGASRLQASDVGPVASNVTVPSEPSSSTQSPAPAEPAPRQQVAEAPVTPSDTTSGPSTTDGGSSFSLDRSSFDNFLQRSNQPSGQSTFSRRPIFQSSTPTTTTAAEPTNSFSSNFSRRFDFSRSLFGNR